MESHLIVPIDGVITCTALDPRGTNKHDDAFRVTMTDTSFQIDTVVTIPPETIVSWNQINEAFSSALPLKGYKQNANHGHVKGLGLEPTKALICTSVVHTKKERPNELIFSEVSVGYASAVVVTHEKVLASSLETQISMVETLLALTSELPARYFKSYNYQLSQSKIRGLIYGLNLIFNQTCRNAAAKVDVPFVGKDPAGNLSCKYISNALFNKPLRDIGCLINVMNLSRYIEGEEVADQYNLKKIFPEQFSKEELC